MKASYYSSLSHSHSIIGNTEGEETETLKGGGHGRSGLKKTNVQNWLDNFKKLLSCYCDSFISLQRDQHTSTLPPRVSAVCPCIATNFLVGVALVVFLRSNYLVLYTIMLVSFNLNCDVKLFCGTAMLFLVCFSLRIHFVESMWNTQQVGPWACHKVAVTRTTKLKLLFKSFFCRLGTSHISGCKIGYGHRIWVCPAPAKSPNIGIFVEVGPYWDLWWH